MLSTSSHAIASKAENVLSDIISGQTSVRSRLKKVFIYYGNVETYHKEDSRCAAAKFYPPAPKRPSHPPQ